MSGISGIGGGAMSVDRVMALRSQILERNQALSRAGAAGNVAPTEPATLGNVVQMSEFQAIRDMLAACGGSRIETARRLGISERTLRYRLAKAREQGDDLARPFGADTAWAVSA